MSRDESIAGTERRETSAASEARLPRRRSARERAWSPARLAVVVAAAIFCTEFLIMLVLTPLIALSPGWKAAIDAATLLLVLSPVYFLLYRPFWERHQRSEEEVHRLSQQLIRSGEEERGNLARDLHDECGQVLAALQFGFATLKHSLPARTPEVEAQCDRLSGMLAQLMNKMRTITSRLRPAALDAAGLAATLRRMCQGFTARWEIEVGFAQTGAEVRLPSEVELTLFRICQEALTNIAKHARATRGMVVLAYEPALVTLTVSDNGAGFDPVRTSRENAGREHPGIGLAGMRERATGLEGVFQIDTARGRGTVIQVRLPIRSVQHEPDSSGHRGRSRDGAGGFAPVAQYPGRHPGGG